MQIVEYNSFGLRVVVSRFRHGSSPLEILLLPMIHLGTPDFYEKVSSYLRGSDAIIYEGVRSRRAAVLFRAQRIIQRYHEGDFIYQSQGIDLKSFGDKLVHGDVSVATFDEDWRSIPIWIRWLLWVVVPFAAVYLAATGTKDALARALALDDLPSRDEVLRDDTVSTELDRVIVDHRDAKLLDTIRDYVDQHGSEAKTVAILYGAAHMRAVIGFLGDRLGYRLTTADWIVVFET